jgi:uncharacterized membrane protein YGL010W
MFINYRSLYAPIILGLAVPIYLEKMGMSIGNMGIEYYGEVHPSYHNAMIHTIFMPITILGMLLWIPRVAVYIPLIGIKNSDSFFIQRAIYIMYMTHYITINFLMGIMLMIVYMSPLIGSILYYNHRGYQYALRDGLVLSVGALAVQEVFGHYLSGDPMSRIEAIPNAILYAVYFSGGHFIR